MSFSIKTYTYGEIPIQIWEFPAVIFFLILASIIGYQIQRRNVTRHVSFRYFLPGLWVKMLGGLLFALVYIFYYGGGDTISYYECTIPFINLFIEDPATFFRAYFGPGTMEMKSLFTTSTGSPMGYMFFNDKTRVVIKLLFPFLLLSGKSYFVTTLYVAVITYGGLWRLYRMFIYYFPDYSKYLAIAILFMPSVAFWGSGIMKDSFTLAATCYFIVATHQVVTRQGNFVLKWITMIVTAMVILLIKPYILIILIPGTLVWLFYARIQKIQNVYFRKIIVPVLYVVVIFGSYGILTTLGSSLGSFSPDQALKTARVMQRDLKREHYQGHSFDIGEFEATPIGILKKAPVAITAGLFRPFITESRNIVNFVSGVENLFVLIMTLLVLIRMKWRVVYRLIADYPILTYSLFFSLMFALMIGITTPNFGSLVRYRIPLIPLYMATIMVLFSKLNSFRIYTAQQKNLLQ